MAFFNDVVYYSPAGLPAPGLVQRFAGDRGLAVRDARDPADLVELVNRRLPACIVLVPSSDENCVELCRRLKNDSFSAIVPVLFLLTPDLTSDGMGALEAGADEVLTSVMPEREQLLRLSMMLQRADRDVSVNPTTRLPGTTQIERDIGERIRRGELFAVCYADLDHFKEYNDRYGYNEGDRVIVVLSHILRDVVKARAPSGFVGHIGGDDFIFSVPLAQMRICCEEIIETFDELIPYQYNEEDRSAGYFLGKDRRGVLHRTPLMTLSIGVVTNERRVFSHTARVSELATEMKTYAKTLPGSVYAVDRRRDAPKETLTAPQPAGMPQAETSPPPP